MSLMNCYIIQEGFHGGELKFDNHLVKIYCATDYSNIGVCIDGHFRFFNEMYPGVYTITRMPSIEEAYGVSAVLQKRLKIIIIKMDQGKVECIRIFIF
jgi:hypothetical protein